MLINHPDLFFSPYTFVVDFPGQTISTAQEIFSSHVDKFEMVGSRLDTESSTLDISSFVCLTRMFLLLVFVSSLRG